MLDGDKLAVGLRKSSRGHEVADEDALFCFCSCSISEYYSPLRCVQAYMTTERSEKADDKHSWRERNLMSQNIIDAVCSNYGAVAQRGLSSDQDGVRAVAEAFGYTVEE